MVQGMDSTLAVNTLEAGYPCKVLEFIHFGRVHDKGLGMIFSARALAIGAPKMAGWTTDGLFVT